MKHRRPLTVLYNYVTILASLVNRPIAAAEREAEMLTAKDVARYFLSLSDPDIGDTISNLKLQKLLYYAQGCHLAITDKPLFNDSIEAWTHGPVVRSLYRSYKSYGSDGIPAPDDLDLSVYDEETKEILDEVYSVFGQYSAWKLRNMTHEEAPWKIAYESGNSIISHDAMKDYFASFVNKDG